MKKQYEKWFLALSLLTISTVIVLFSLLRTNPTDTRVIQTNKQITSNNLIFEYENQALEKFIEEVIEIDGVVKELKFKNNIYTLYLTDENNETYILCELQDDQKNKALNLMPGENVKVKGILKGHLKDIILLNCIIL